MCVLLDRNMPLVELVAKGSATCVSDIDGQVCNTGTGSALGAMTAGVSDFAPSPPLTDTYLFI